MTYTSSPIQEKATLDLNSLDALRGFLAVYVLAGHCRWLLWTDYGNWIQNPHSFWEKSIAIASSSLRYGHEAVVVFFVLSGFFIHLRNSKQLAETKTFQFDLGRFCRRRLHRLVPPYVLALLITILFDVIGMSIWPDLYQASTGDSLLDLNFARKGYSIASVLPAIVLLPSSFGMDFGSNGPFWSLSYEIIYYAIYPIWLILRRQSKSLAYGVGVIIPLISLFIFPSNFMSLVLQHYPIWLCGAFMAESLIQPKISNTLNTKKSLRLIIALGLGLGFIGLHFTGSTLLTLVCSALIGSTAVLITLGCSRYLSHHWSHKIFENLGLKSYTLYICHFPIVTLISAWIIHTTGGRPDHGWLALSGFCLTLLICIACFHLCEKNFLHERLKLQTR